MTACDGYEWIKADEMNKFENSYTIYTQSWDRYTFNPKTGEIISSRRASSILNVSVIVSVCCISMMVLLIWKIKSNKRINTDDVPATGDA